MLVLAQIIDTARQHKPTSMQKLFKIKPTLLGTTCVWRGSCSKRIIKIRLIKVSFISYFIGLYICL
nr:hypothetical protein [Mycoplasmopsis bovis]